MNRKQIIALFETLAMSQGFYGRLLNSLANANEDQRENFLLDLEERKFTDPVQLVTYLESDFEG
jgi:hypothetical protein